MKLTRLKIMLMSLAFILSGSVMAQKRLARKAALNTPVIASECLDALPVLPDDPVAVHPLNVQMPVSFRSGTEYPVGTTIYDLQSNNSVDDRTSRGPDGSLMAIWTMGFDNAGGYSDRGTGYNRTTDGAWGDQPTQRLEASTRIGWPSHVVTESGTEVIISHSSANHLHVVRREAGSSTWEEFDIPSAIYPEDGGPGLLWPRATVSGEVVHVLCITQPIANGGAEYEGVDGHPLYYRSSDGGATWDKVDVILPGLDNTALVANSGDSYAVDARGDNVAIGFFNNWSDQILMKSTDGGENWTKTIMHDFPLELYVQDSGYSFEDLPPYDPDQPDSLAILTSDECGAVVLDHQGMAHVFWGRMYIMDDDLTDGNTSFFPGTSGLHYWNETFGPDSSRVITDVIDLNGNDTLDINSVDEIASYEASLSSQPSAGVDAQGNIYLAYASVMEGEQYLNTDDNQHYRHVYIMASADNGETWTDPYDIINEDVVVEPDLVDYVEAVFPAMASDVSGTIDLTYQGDFRPGMSVRGDMDIAETNFINHVPLTPEQIGLVKTEEAVEPGFFQLEVLPNPATSEVITRFTLKRNAPYTLGLYNMMGQNVAGGADARGEMQNELRFDVSNLPKGIYFIRLQAEDKVAVTKLMVQ
ncbi:MAG: T9SS type A sorting domain-containing protein [Phaeodactylibacter sp.]|nr:T9SS type A sorting domain-containing protein [Phaeodactylibacter sp.]MCB9287259.1 T9SS type A sorting domain-containing protein [Lewinellaceae bacterium]